MTISAPAFQHLAYRLRDGWKSVTMAGAGLLLALGLAQVLVAQVAGERGIAPVASSTDIAVGGIEVNATGRNPADARKNGWMQAQRKAWERLEGPQISDSDLQDMVSAVIIESEELGPRRYVATLGVVFDRARAGPLIGRGDGPQTRSAPLLTIPVLRSGGTYTVYETRNLWQRAWAEYQAGASPIDYVRPTGAGGDSLLLNYGQLDRRSRSWWRNILDAFGAADVISPVVHLERQWPGGPVTGTFSARYGPDNELIESFSLRVQSEQGVPGMLETAIERLDAIYSRALDRGVLRPDPTLRVDELTLDPAIAALINAEEQAVAAQQAAAEAGLVIPPPAAPDPAATPQVVTSFVVQFATPDAAAVDAVLAAVRGTPGVRGASTSSIAIGGVSVMRVSYGGDIGALAQALRARGFTVTQGSTALSISR